MDPAFPAGPPDPPSTRRSAPVLLIAALVLVLVVLVAGAAVIVVTLWPSDDAATGERWNAVVAVDRRSGEVTVLDPGGARLDRFDTDIADPEVYVVGSSHLVVEGLKNDRETIAIVDVGSGDVIDLDLDDDIAPGDLRDLRIRPVRGADAFTVGDDAQPGPAYLVTLDGEVVDIALEARWDEPFISSQTVSATPDGSAVALVDFSSRDTQTAIVSLVDLDVVIVDGSLVSLSDTQVRTTTRRDSESFEIVSYDRSGERLDSFSVDPFRIGIDAADGDLFTASIDGEIRRWSPDGGSERVAEFEVGAAEDFAPATRTDGSDPTLAIADAEGGLLLVGSDGDVIDDIRLDGPVLRFGLGRRCVPAITDTSVAIVETGTGEVLAEEPIGDGNRAFLGATSDDGCTVFAFGNGDDVFGVLAGADHVVEFGARESLAGLSGDGSSYAVRDSDGAITVRDLGDATRERIDLDVGDFATIYFLRR